MDILVKDNKGDLIIIEIQNAYFPNYLMRMLFGISKVINDNMKQGESYGNVKKVISVNIVYFDLGHGKDYVYHGSTQFKGIHDGDILKLTATEQSMYHTDDISKIYPEFYIIKVNDFNTVAKNNLDEWINFLKTETIQKDTTAKGLKEASERLVILQLSDEERMEYDRYLMDCSDNYELIYGNYERGEIEGKMNGMLEGKLEIAQKCRTKGMPIAEIAELTGLTEDEVRTFTQ